MVRGVEQAGIQAMGLGSESVELFCHSSLESIFSNQMLLLTFGLGHVVPCPGTGEETEEHISLLSQSWPDGTVTIL